MLVIRRLEVELGGRRVLEDLDFSLAAGELMVVLGPNGAGKSTLLRTLAGELSPCQGDVEFGGQPLARWPRRALARQRAVMPQRVEVSFPLTVNEVIALGRQQEPAARRNQVMAELRSLLDIGHLQHRLVPSLSGGEQQRVQLARVLAQVWDSDEQVLLLLDECTSALDPAHQQQVFGVLRWLACERGFAVLAVAHDLNLAARFAHRLLLLNAGRCHKIGSPDGVLTANSLQTVYGLSARILMLEEGWPLVIPQGDSFWPGFYSASQNASCRQAS